MSHHPITKCNLPIKTPAAPQEGSSGSWWASGLSREAFTAKVKAEAHRLRHSKGQHWVSAVSYDERLTAARGGK
jgi:hypothetical protein